MEAPRDAPLNLPSVIRATVEPRPYPAIAEAGYYYPETFDWLREHGPVDYLISECTFGTQPGRGDHPDGHLDWNSCLHLFRQLFEQGTLRAESHIYLTHINHCHNSTHEDLVQMARENADLPCPITVSYDGMQITD